MPGDPVVPQTETRGGEHPDWDRAKPGEPVPERENEPPDTPRGVPEGSN